MKTSGMHMSSVKEACDNLSRGLCYFDNHDRLRLCNRQMYSLGFMVINREIQSREDMELFFRRPDADSGISCDRDTYLFPDGSAWTFRKKSFVYGSGKVWTEYLALNVTELHRRKQELEKRNEEQRVVMDRLERIARNVVTISREEEILSLKMKIHNELGVVLQSTRRFIAMGCPAEEKKKYCAEQLKMAGVLMGEVGNDDEVNVYEELNRIAGRLGMKIITRGELPGSEELRNLISMAVRECLTNTIRHAGGDTVTVCIKNEKGFISAAITNNGRPPVGTVIEGGGLSSLRYRTERMGGKMLIAAQPVFKLMLILPGVVSEGER